MDIIQSRIQLVTIRKCTYLNFISELLCYGFNVKFCALVDYKENICQTYCFLKSSFFSSLKGEIYPYFLKATSKRNIPSIRQKKVFEFVCIYFIHQRTLIPTCNTCFSTIQ